MTAHGPGLAFALANAVGLLAFAVAGALKGSDAGLDLFGVTTLGVITALGGGIVRDVLVGRIPVALSSITDVGVALVGVGVAVVLARRRRVGAVRDRPAFLVSDAVGLAAFTATGALVGLEAGVSPFGVVLLATLTGVGGGSLSDLLLTRVPVVLREDFYATPAVVGGTVLWVGRTAAVGAGVATAACVGAVLALRGAALYYDWRLPTVETG